MRGENSRLKTKSGRTRSRNPEAPPRWCVHEPHLAGGHPSPMTLSGTEPSWILPWTWTKPTKGRSRVSSRSAFPPWRMGVTGHGTSCVSNIWGHPCLVEKIGAPLSVGKQPEWAGLTQLWDTRTRWALGWSLL